MDNSTQPLFRQIASLVEDAIVDGTLGEGDRAPSTNELADFHNINPATARKGISLLVDIGVLDKRRGIGMFVTANAREVITSERRGELAGSFIAPLIDEALRLGYTRAELHTLIDKVAESRGMYR